MMPAYVPFFHTKYPALLALQRDAKCEHVCAPDLLETKLCHRETRLFLFQLLLTFYRSLFLLISRYQIASILLQPTFNRPVSSYREESYWCFNRMAFSYAVAMSWFCFFLLGFGGWNVLNSLFLEAPLFAAALPEGANISTSLLIAQQIASVLVFVPTQIWQNGARRFYPHIIIGTLSLAIISCIILMFWSLEAIGGFSFPLLLMAVISSCIGYISTTYYFPFVSLYRGLYTNAYSLGLGFSLAFTAAMSLAQDSGAANPRFGVRGFFGIILGSNTIAFLGALWLIFSPTAKTQLVSYQKDSEDNSAQKTEKCVHQLISDQGTPISKQLREYEAMYPPAQVGYKMVFGSWRVLKVYWYPAFLQVVLAFLGFGTVPALLPYAASSYFNGSAIYMWSISMLYLIDPIARTIYSLHIKLFSNPRHLAITTSLCFAIGAFICILSFIAPTYLPARDSKSGGGLAIALACVFGWLYASSFTGSYTMMFNLGTECDPDALYKLQKQVRLSDNELIVEQSQPSEQHLGVQVIHDDSITTQSVGTEDYRNSSITISIPIEVEPNLTKDSHQTVNASCDDPNAPCPICTRDALDRDALRQMIYRLSGLGLQLGSFVGTFLAASLTVFSATLPDPVVPDL